MIAATIGSPYVQNNTAQLLIRLNEECGFLDRAFEASEGIRTIDPHDKVDESVLKPARDAIRDAECIYILGFGFDRRNCERIGLQSGPLQLTLGQRPKRVFFTNLDNSNRINKEASKAFFGYSDGFQESGIRELRGSQGHYFERSVRNCYDAFALDFDEIEIE
jgi:hypothetical protein